MALSLITSLRNTRANANNAAVGASSIIRIYSGALPATVSDPLSGNTLLAELACSATAFGASANGVITANPVSNDPTANNSGTATFFRHDTAGGLSIWQGTAGTSGADLNLNIVTITAGQTVAISSYVIAEPNV